MEELRLLINTSGLAVMRVAGLMKIKKFLGGNAA